MHKSVHAHTHAVISWPTLFFCSSASQVTWLMQIPMYQWYINKRNILINIIIQSIVKHTHMSVHAHTYVVICWPTFCFSVPQLCRGPGGCVQGRICPTQWKLPARLQVVSLLNLFLSFLCTCKDDSLQSNSWFYFKLTMSAGYGFGGGGGSLALKLLLVIIYIEVMQLIETLTLRQILGWSLFRGNKKDNSWPFAVFLILA